MTIRSSYIAMAVALVLIVAAIVPVLAFANRPSHLVANGLSMAALLLFGAVTVTYKYPVQGIVAPVATTPPFNTVRGTVQATADADTTATITHNFNLSTTARNLGQPEVTLTALLTQFYTSTWTYAVTDANTITLTKGTGGGSGTGTPQLAFFIRRPHSIAI